MQKFQNTKRPAILTVTGPPGAGKTSVARELSRSSVGIKQVLSTTTRPPRQSDLMGPTLEYRYVATERFDEYKENGWFVEAVVRDGYQYGIMEEDFSQLFSDGKTNTILAVVDRAGASKLWHHYGGSDRITKVESALILPPDRASLVDRIVNRDGIPHVDAEARVLDESQDIIGDMCFYDYVVVNRDFRETVDAIKTIAASLEFRQRIPSDESVEIYNQLGAK